ncbi:hypothetical protein HJG54_24005 [Leptolyngbya sp. NK1-12]|uniref:Uncharacterized protein n=1 Tax=Leptolyngbya sp. NK1-12 TaxID=2547451 RepID=A0AA96WGC0_9CYAN|nr:hypothetical protein [Leptolyngbya sp. NK1-12]WNZ25597.1 hypothetical protein HJG54_24005 [Leptolyngbya sp. NK1-12]
MNWGDKFSIKDVIGFGSTQTGNFQPKQQNFDRKKANVGDEDRFWWDAVALIRANLLLHR